MTKAEKSWILYDVANSAFVLVVVTAVMPIYFKEIAAFGIPSQLSTAWWGYANSLASFLLVIMAPVLGTCADFPGWKKRLFALFLTLGLISTALLFFTGPGTWFACLALFVVARTSWGGANIFYDSFITDITSPFRMDRVSTAGYAWGYIGSVVPFLAVIGLLLTLKSPQDTGSISAVGARIGFLVVACWWGLFSLPLLMNVQQKFSSPLTATPLGDTFRNLAETFRHLRSYRRAFLFLLAYFFFIDGVDTIITMAVAYGVDLGLSSATLILAILVIQIVAFPFALLWGKLSDSFPVKPLLMAGIIVYCLITVLAFFLPALPTMALKKGMFWLLSILVASSMGGIQALSRSYFAKLIPPEHSAEFFGFYNISGKFATITGPFLVGITGQLTGQSRYGVLSILLLFLIGGALLAAVPKDAPDE